MCLIFIILMFSYLLRRYLFLFYRGKIRAKKVEPVIRTHYEMYVLTTGFSLV